MRLEDASGIAELNSGGNLSVEPRTNSSGDAARSDARGNIVKERACTGAESAEGLQADGAKLDPVAKFQILAVLASFGQRSRCSGCLSASRYIGGSARMADCRIPRHGPATHERKDRRSIWPFAALQIEPDWLKRRGHSGGSESSMNSSVYLFVTSVAADSSSAG